MEADSQEGISKMKEIKSEILMEEGFVGYKLSLYEDGTVSLYNENGNLITDTFDRNGFCTYFSNDSGEFIYKHMLIVKYLFNGSDNCRVKFLDGDNTNLNINNMVLCDMKDYRAIQIELSKNHDEMMADRKKKSREKKLQNTVHKATYNEEDVFYQVKLPNGDKHKLIKNVSIEEKKLIVESLLAQWDDVILENWNSNSITFFLDSLANYLVWHNDKDEIRKRNGEILSNRKNNKMVGLERDSNLSYLEADEDKRERFY